MAFSTTSVAFLGTINRLNSDEIVPELAILVRVDA